MALLHSTARARPLLHSQCPHLRVLLPARSSLTLKLPPVSCCCHVSKSLHLGPKPPVASSHREQVAWPPVCFLMSCETLLSLTPVSSVTSSLTIFQLVHSTAATVVSLMFPRPAGHTPTSGPLHWFFVLAFPDICKVVASSSSTLCSKEA